MIDPELRSLIDKSIEIAEENQKILKKLNSTRRWGVFFTLLKWGIIIGITFGAFYYVEPYLQKAMDTYDRLNSTITEVQKTSDTVKNSNLLDQIRSLF